jgi:hypothetical protein
MGCLACLSALSFACAVSSRTASLRGDEVAERAPGNRLAVLPFDDARPNVQRADKRPFLSPLLVWNRRAGCWADERTPARGRARLRVSVHDCDERLVVIDESVRGDFTSPHLPLSTVAVVALDRALRRLGYEVDRARAARVAGTP